MPKITWEFDPVNNAVDAVIVNKLHSLVQFVNSNQAEQEPGSEPKENAKTTEPKAAAEPKTAANAEKPKQQKPRKKQQRKPKKRDKDALAKFDLPKMIEYLEAREEADLLECRFLAKHYSDSKGGSDESVDKVLNVLHESGANDFAELSDHWGFVTKIIELVKSEQDDDDQSDDSNDDPFGI